MLGRAQDTRPAGKPDVPFGTTRDAGGAGRYGRAFWSVRSQRYDSPRGWGAFELLPVAPVGVAGLVARHPVGELTVDRVGELGDVAQGAGLAGPLGEGVLLEAVLGRELGEPDGPVEQLLGRRQLVHDSQHLRLRRGEGLAEQARAGGDGLAPGVGEHADVHRWHRDSDRHLVEPESGPVGY